MPTQSPSSRLRPLLLLLSISLTGAAALGCASVESPDAGQMRDAYRPPPRDAGYRDRCGEAGAANCEGGVVMPGEDAGPPPSCNDITFRYMNPTASSVWISGTFTTPAWAPDPASGAIEMVNDGAGNWTAAVEVPSGVQEYKLILDGTTWISDPSAERTISDGLSGRNSQLFVCEAAPTCDTVTFRYVNAAATSVWVSGTFTDPLWAPDLASGALPMTRVGADTWEVTASLPSGTHEYKYVVDGGAEWVVDPGAEGYVDDGFGGSNSVVYVCEGAGGCGDPGTFDWRDAVMYFAMIDRFADGDGSSDPVPGATDGDARTGSSGQYEGGDLPGLTDRLGYLADLGVTAVWISAPYENRDSAGAAIDPGADSHQYSAYHGYWPSPANTDYSDPMSPSPRPQVESRIGTDADLHTFVDTAHATMGADGEPMKVLFDYVMNHVDVESGLYTSHPDWFATYADGSRPLCGPMGLWDDPYWGVRCAFTDYLPAFDFDNPAPRAWSVNDALWWAREYDLDGYRLDAIKHVPLSWLMDLRARLNEEITDPTGGRFYLVGETFAYDDQALIRSFVDPDAMLDGQFDFPLKARLCEAVFTPSGSLANLEGFMNDNDRYYGRNAIMTTWIGNHDIPRTVHFASRQIGSCREGSSPGNGWNSGAFSQPTDAVPYERMAVSFAILMTNPGIPLIYYGDEVGLAGGGDPDNRRMMPASDSELNPHQLALRDRVRALARLRVQNRALSRGRRTTVSVDQDTWVYTMGGCGSEIPDATVAINRSDSTRSVSIPAGSYTDLLEGGSVSGGTIMLPARSYRVLGP